MNNTSQTYRNILIGNSGTISAPKSKIEKDWRISEKAGRENFFEKAFSFWKNSCLPAKIQIMLLKICNHELKLNAQLRHFATDEQGIRVKPECTFCTISDEENIEKETYKHFFLILSYLYCQTINYDLLMTIYLVETETETLHSS